MRNTLGIFSPVAGWGENEMKAQDGGSEKEEEGRVNAMFCCEDDILKRYILFHPSRCARR